MEEVAKDNKKEYAPEFDEDGKLKLRSIVDIVADLKKPIHPSKLKERLQGGQKIKYIAWYDATQYLDKYAPGWSYHVDDVTFAPNGRIVTRVTLSIPCLEGVVSRSAVGTEEPEGNKKMFGDICSNSESMALRRACSKVGLGLHLYQK